MTVSNLEPLTLLILQQYYNLIVWTWNSWIQQFSTIPARRKKWQHVLPWLSLILVDESMMMPSFSLRNRWKYFEIQLFKIQFWSEKGLNLKEKPELASTNIAIGDKHWMDLIEANLKDNSEANSAVKPLMRRIDGLSSCNSNFWSRAIHILKSLCKVIANGNIFNGNILSSWP
jgi:hypothetical protein